MEQKHRGKRGGFKTQALFFLQPKRKSEITVQKKKTQPKEKKSISKFAFFQKEVQLIQKHTHKHK